MKSNGTHTADKSRFLQNESKSCLCVYPRNWRQISAPALNDGISSLVSRGTSLRIPRHKKHPRYWQRDTRRARADDTYCIPRCFLPPRVTDLADVGLHIFNHFFLQIPQSARFSFPFVFFLSRGHEPLYYVSLFFSLSPSVALHRNACARFTPKSGYFRLEKRAKKARIRYTKHEGRFWSACASEAVQNERMNKRRPEQKENGGEEGCRHGGEERIESKTAMVAKGK